MLKGMSRSASEKSAGRTRDGSKGGTSGTAAGATVSATDLMANEDTSGTAAAETRNSRRFMGDLSPVSFPIQQITVHDSGGTVSRRKTIVQLFRLCCAPAHGLIARPG